MTNIRQVSHLWIWSRALLGRARPNSALLGSGVWLRMINVRFSMFDFVTSSWRETLCLFYGILAWEINFRHCRETLCNFWRVAFFDFWNPLFSREVERSDSGLGHVVGH